MKKLFVFLISLFIVATTLAQDYGVSYTVTSPSVYTSFYIKAGNTLKVKSTHADYSILKDLPAHTLVSTAISDLTTLYPVGSTSASTATITTLTSTAATITTLTAGGKTLTRKNANGGTYAGSLTLATGDTAFVPVVSATAKVLIGATTDTTVKTIGLMVVGTQLYYCNGSYYYKVTYAH